MSTDNFYVQAPTINTAPTNNTSATSSYWSYLNPGSYVKSTGSNIADGVEGKLLENIKKHGEEYAKTMDTIVTLALIGTPPKIVHDLKEILLTISNNNEVHDSLLTNAKKLLSSLDTDTLKKLGANLKDEANKPVQLSQSAIDLFGALKSKFEKCSSLDTAPQYYKIPLDVQKDAKDLAGICEKLVLCNSGALVKAMQYLSTQGAEVGARTIDDQLNRTAHPVLEEAFALVDTTIRTLDHHPKDAALKKLTLKLQEKLQDLINVQQEAFKREPLLPDEYKLLEELLKHLKTVQDAHDLSHLKAKLSQDLKTVGNILFKHLNSEQGVIARTMSAIHRTLNPLIERLEVVPRNMYHHFKTPHDLSLGAHTMEPPPVHPSHSTAPAQPNETLGNYLSIGLTTLQGLSTNLAGGISAIAIKNCANSLVWGLEHGLQWTQGKEEYRQINQLITGILPRARTAIDNGSWTELGNIVRTTMAGVNEHQIYLNGLRLPRFGGYEETKYSALPKLFDNVRMLDKAPSAPMKKEDIEKNIALEKVAFARNTASYTALTTVWESRYFCGLPLPDNNFYFRILEQANRTSPQQPESKVRSLFFEEIDNAYQKGDISFPRKIIAKASFFIVRPLASFFISQFSDKIVEDVRTKIKGNLKDIGNTAVVNFSRYLTTLDSAYRRVAHANYDVLLNEMLEKELEQPQCNRDRKPAEIYKSVAKKGVQEYAPRVTWTQRIQRSFQWWKLAPSSLPKRSWNLIIDGTAGLFSFVIYIPQSLANWSLKKIIQQIVVRNQIVDNLVKNSTKSVASSGGYTHAMNCVIYQQLLEIHNLMKTAFESPNAQEASPFKGVDSEQRKEELRTLVKNLFSVLRKSRCDTVGELREAVLGESPATKARIAVEDLFVDDAVQGSMRTIKFALESVLKEDQVEKLIWNFLKGANRSFQEGKQVTPEEFHAVERAIQDLSDKILSLSIEKALEDKLDFSTNNQTKQVHQFLDQFKKTYQEFNAKAVATLHDVRKDVSWDHWKSLRVFKEWIHHITEFQNRKINELFETLANSNYDSETKKHFDTWFTQLANSMKTIGARVLKAFALEVEINIRQRLMNMFHSARTECNNLNAKIQNVAFSLDDRNTVVKAFDALKTKLIEHEKFLDEITDRADLNSSLISPVKQTLVAPLKNLAEQVASELKKYHVKSNVLEGLTGNFYLPGNARSVLSEVKALKEESFNTGTEPPALAFKVQSLLLMSNTLKSLDSNFDLLPLTQKIQSSSNANELEQHIKDIEIKISQHWHSFCAEKGHIAQSINQKTNELNDLINRNNIFNEQYIAERAGLIQGELNALEGEFSQLSQWTTGLKEFPILNIPLSDMNWFKDFAKSFAKKYIKGRIEGLVRFLSQSYNMKYGVLNHLLFIPFTEKK